MRRRNTKVRKLLMIGAITILALTQMCGCAKAADNSIMDALTNGSDIEIKLQKPSYEVRVVGNFEELQYNRLDNQNSDYTAEFREKFNSIFGVEAVAFNEYQSINGCMYINKNGEQDGNTSLIDALRNKVFMEKYLANEYTHEKLAEITDALYADVDAETDNSVIAAINSYWNLTPDGVYEDNHYFNGSKSLTRKEFNELIYRVHSPLTNRYEDIYEYSSWLNKKDGSLREQNLNSPISRAEAIYTLMNMYFINETHSVDTTTSSLADCKNAGNLLEDTISSKKSSDALYTIDKETEQMIIVDGWQLGALSKMMRDTTGGVQVDIYKSLVMANKLGLIEAETRYNEPLSKEDAIEFIIKTIYAVNERDGYLTESEYGDVSIFEKASKNEEKQEIIIEDTIIDDEESLVEETESEDNNTETVENEDITLEEVIETENTEEPEVNTDGDIAGAVEITEEITDESKPE